MLAFVDIKSEEIELIPTSFPTCPKCENYSHYIYFLDDTDKTELESGIDYPAQDLVHYCFNCGYREEIDHSNYYLFSLFLLTQRRTRLSNNLEAILLNPYFTTLINPQTVPIILHCPLLFTSAQCLFVANSSNCLSLDEAEICL